MATPSQTSASPGGSLPRLLSSSGGTASRGASNTALNSSGLVPAVVRVAGMGSGSANDATARSRSASPAVSPGSGGSFSGVPRTTSTGTGPSAGNAASSGSGGKGGLFKAMTLIEYRALRFVIMDAPSDANLAQYVRELQRHGVTDVVRACEPTYSAAALASYSMTLHELNFKDGDPPPPNVVSQWLTLVASKFIPASAKDPPYTGAIAVHCVAGLGRAPALVAIALIEAGMPALEAVEFIRSRRRGAINAKQIAYLDSYKRKGKGRLAGLPTSLGAASNANATGNTCAPGSGVGDATGTGNSGGGGSANSNGSGGGDGAGKDKCVIM